MTDTVSQKLVLFDIDGTLLHTHGAGRRAIRQALMDELGTTDPPDGFRFDGKTDPQIIMELMTAAGHPKANDPASIDGVCNRYADFLSDELRSNELRVEVLRGVVELLDQLSSSEHIVGLLTGNIERGAMLKLQSAGLDPAIFIVGAFGSDSPERKDLPQVASDRAAPLMGEPPQGHDVVIIGDTPADVACGGDFGARAIAVATGSYTREELEAAGPHATFDDLSDTRSVLDAVLL